MLTPNTKRFLTAVLERIQLSALDGDLVANAEACLELRALLSEEQPVIKVEGENVGG